MPEPAFAYNAEMCMPDGTPFPTHANFPEGTAFYIKDVGGTWHEARIVDFKRDGRTWHRLTGRTKQF